MVEAVSWLKRLLASVGLSGIALDLACGCVLAAATMAATPLIGLAVRFLWSKAGAFLDGFRRGLGAFAYNRLFFPGVAMHEACHWAAAKISGCDVKSVRFYSPGPDGSLGHVLFVPKGSKSRMAMQMAVVSCAPAFGCPILAYAFIWSAIRLSWNPWLVLFCVHGALSAICHASMSRRDLGCYARGCVGMAWRVFLICFVLAFIVKT